MVMASLLVHFIDWMRTMTTPMLRMFLIAVITGDATYMPPKASVVPHAPLRQGQAMPKAVRRSMSTDAKAGRPFWAPLGRKVS